MNGKADFDTDVFVCGGGPAGLAAAVAARRRGFRVMLADAERPPIDKPCGEGLMPDALRALALLGISLEHGRPFRGISFLGEAGHVAADFPAGSGLGVRRRVLQESLASSAHDAGVDLLWGERITGIEHDTVICGSRRLRARWIIGADGAQSSVRRWASLDRFSRDNRRFSFRRHYRVRAWSQHVEIHWGRQCQFYVTPVGSNEVSLVLMTRDPKCRMTAMLQHFPTLKECLGSSEASSNERGAVAATRRLRRVTRGNVALLGDASGTVDPISGDGLCLAFKQAIALADALAAGNLSRYERAHIAIGRRPRLMSDLMLLMDRSQLLQTRALRAFQVRPQLFSNLLAMHVGELRPFGVARTMAVLGWKVATV